MGAGETARELFKPYKAYVNQADQSQSSRTPLEADTEYCDGFKMVRMVEQRFLEKRTARGHSFLMEIFPMNPLVAHRIVSGILK